MKQYFDINVELITSCNSDIGHRDNNIIGINTWISFKLDIRPLTRLLSSTKGNFRQDGNRKTDFMWTAKFTN